MLFFPAGALCSTSWKVCGPDLSCRRDAAPVCPSITYANTDRESLPAAPAAARPDSRHGGRFLARRRAPAACVSRGDALPARRWPAWTCGRGKGVFSPCCPVTPARDGPGDGAPRFLRGCPAGPCRTDVFCGGVFAARLPDGRQAGPVKKRRPLAGPSVVVAGRCPAYRLAATLRSRRMSWLVKPASLSYQMMSLAMVPSMTWVDRASMTPP